MKTLRKSAIIIVGLALITLLCAFWAGIITVKVKADGEDLTETVQEVDTENNSETAADEKVNAVIGKVNQYLNTANGVYETRILPLLIGCGASISMTAFCVIFVIKKVKKWKDKYNIVASAFNELDDKAKGYKGIIDKTDNSDLKAEINAIKDELKDIKDIKDIVLHIKQGALQAWAESPDAVRELSSSEIKND